MLLVEVVLEKDPLYLSKNSDLKVESLLIGEEAEEVYVPSTFELQHSPPVA